MNDLHAVVSADLKASPDSRIALGASGAKVCADAVVQSIQRELERPVQ